MIICAFGIAVRTTGILRTDFSGMAANFVAEVIRYGTATSNLSNPHPMSGIQVYAHPNPVEEQQSRDGYNCV